MKWSLQQLKKINTFPYQFETSYNFKEVLTSTIEDVYDINETIVTGKIIRIDEETYQFDYNINTKLTLACSLTLEPVDYQLNDEFSDVYSTKQNEDWFKIEKNTINLEEMVWANIVMAIPIRIVRDDAYEILKERGITLESDFEE